jgi:hypothetical protein
MAIIKHYGEVKEGKLIPFNRKRLNNDISLMKDGEVEIVIKKKGKRSLQSNKYYWGCVLPEILHELKRLGNDFDADTIHEYLKQKFNSEKVVVEATGELIEIGKKTSELNQEEFGLYLDKVIMWAAQTLEITIPEPNSQALLFND